MTMKSIVRKLAIALPLLAWPALAENPMEFREYRQEFTIAFESAVHAESAALSLQPLPAEYELAYSSRWDDSNDKHLKTHAIMMAHAIRGTFFLTDWGNAQIMKQLLEGGCSIGLHTISHPVLPALNSYEHFHQYMENRICLETVSQSPVNSQVLPFCNWWAPEPMVPQSIGWAMRATGVISAPDVMFPNREREMGYPENCLAQSRFIAPGDLNPDLERFDREMKAALADKRNLSLQPSISMAMHSWHTPEGLVNLDKAYASVANNPKWWYCNQNDFGAYRYEALNCRIATRRDDNKLHVSISRMEPFELGANVPLWIAVENATPTAIDGAGASLHGSRIELPHDRAHRLPSVYGRTDSRGESAQIPFAKMTLRHPAANEWTAQFNTSDGLPVENLTFTFRFPAAWDRPTLRQDAGTTGAIAVSAWQKGRKDGMYYRYGRPYYAVQADFVRNDVRYRLYAELREDAEPGLPLTIGDAAQYYIQPETPDMAAISRPENNPLALGLTRQHPGGKPNSVPGVLSPSQMNADKWGKYGYLAIAQFRPIAPGKLTVVSTASDPHMGSEIWLNGEKITFNDRKAQITPRDGDNRLAIRSPLGRMQFVFLNGETAPCVEFLKAEDEQM